MDGAGKVGHLSVAGRIPEVTRSAVPEPAAAWLRTAVRERRRHQSADCHRL